MGAGTVGLELDTVFEVIEDAAVHIQTDEPAVEPGTAVGAFLVAVLVSADDVAAHLGLADKVGNLIAVLRLLVLLCESGKPERERKGRRQGDNLFHIGH